MSSFVEDTAEEEREEGQQASGDNEEPAASGDDPLDSSEEDDDSDNNEYDKTDGFLVDEEDEGEEDGAAKRRKKRKKRRRIEEGLAEGDYELLEDAGVHRQRHLKRRIRRIADEEDEDLLGAQGLEDDDVPIPRDAARHASPEEEREIDLDDDDDFIEHDLDEGDNHRRRRGRASGVNAPQGVSTRAYQEAMDLFDMGADDLLQVYEAAKASRQAREGVGRVEELEEEDYEEDDEDQEEEEPEDVEDEDAAEARAEKIAVRAARKERRRRRQMAQKSKLDPEVVKRAHLTDQDLAIRETDAPERHQLSLLGLPKALTEEHLDWAACAEWVYTALFERLKQGNVRRDEYGRPVAGPNGEWQVVDEDLICRRYEGYLVESGRLEVQGEGPPGGAGWGGANAQAEDVLHGGLRELGSHRGLRHKRQHHEIRRWREDVRAQTALKTSIHKVLELLWSVQLEVPVIGMYAKEVSGELLALHRDDEPDTVTEQDQSVFQNQQRVVPPLGTVVAETRRMRRWDVLWCIFYLSLRWRQLQRLKAQRRRVIVGLESAAEDAALQGRYSACLDALDQATTSEELRDVDVQLQLVKDLDPRFSVARLSISSPADANGDAPAAPRRPTATSSYAHAKRQEGLDMVIAATMLTGEQLAENVQTGSKVHVPSDPQKAPAELLPDYVQALDEAAVGRGLYAIRHIAACELAACAPLRRALRGLLLNMATVSTMETAQGTAEFDAFHLHASVRRLRNKPLAEFNDSDQYLHIMAAKSKGLITVDIGVSASTLQRTLLPALSQLYMSDGTTDTETYWNQLRGLILEEALQKYILPNFAKELHVRLLADARTYMLRKTQSKIWRMATEPPVRLYDEEEALIEMPTIAAACWGPGGPGRAPTTFVLVDHTGAVRETLALAHFSGDLRPRRRSDELEYSLFQDPVKMADAKRLRDWLLKHKPAVVFVGTGCSESKDLKHMVDSVRDYILENQPKELADFATGGLDVKFADDALAGAWQLCSSAAEEFAGSNDVFRRAVALARMAIDPLGILAACAGEGREVLTLDLHVLQHMATDEQRMAAIQQTVVTAVSQLGFKINTVRPGHWLSHTLQFVPGLGPRKAAALLKGVAQHGHSLYSRADLLQHFMGGVVFRNAAPFINIEGGDDDMDEGQDSLDSTRVHPLQYKLAQAVAASAVEQPLDSEGAVSRVRDPANVHVLDSTDLLALDRHLQSAPTAIEPDALALHAVRHPTQLAASAVAGSESLPSQLASMIDIVFELQRPYEDLRAGSSQLKEDDVFHLVLGDRHRTLKVGKPVEVQVLYVTRDLAVCTVPDVPGLTARLPRGAISGSADVDPRDLLKPGDVHIARITELTPRDFGVAVTTRSAEVGADQYWEEARFGRDVYYHVVTQEEREERTRAQTRGKKRGVTVRSIKNPHYADATVAEVMERLRDRQDGDFLFSPEGITRLKLTIRLYSQATLGFGPVMQQLTIKEEGPVPAQPALRLRLKGPLRLTWCRQDYVYDDLDELIARFLEPYLDAVRSVTMHRKFVPERWDTVQELLRRERLQNRMAVYRIGLSSEGRSAGMFYFGWVNNKTPYREYFGVLPNGTFYYGGRVQEGMRDVEQLIGVFKKRVATNQAAMDAVPHRTPVHHYGGGGGWQGAPPPPSYGAPTY